MFHQKQIMCLVLSLQRLLYEFYLFSVCDLKCLHENGTGLTSSSKQMALPHIC